MNILVIGAAGKLGSEVVKQGLASGHQITAFVHNAGEYESPAGVHVVEGDATDAAAVAAAVQGHDAVLDTLGGKTPYKETTLEASTARNVVRAMQQTGARRLVVTSALGEGDSLANTGFFYEHLLLPTFLRGSTKDKAAMEAEVKSSDLDWTILRPAILTDGEATGNVRTYSPDSPEEKAHKISRADVAAFMLQQLTDQSYIGEAVTIATS